MSLKDNIAKDIIRIMNKQELAEVTTYDGTPITVIPQINEDNGKGNTFTNDGHAAGGFFWILEADVPYPNPGSVIAYKGINWTVARLVSTAGGLHKVAVTGRESVY
ncbi:MAG: hypothetical protein ABFC57_17365 [Veillonellales bacterium]